eukprot:4496875-Pyramimonas_sp.AAC.1
MVGCALHLVHPHRHTAAEPVHPARLHRPRRRQGSRVAALLPGFNGKYGQVNARPQGVDSSPQGVVCSGECKASGGRFKPSGGSVV